MSERAITILDNLSYRSVRTSQSSVYSSLADAITRVLRSNPVRRPIFQFRRRFAHLRSRSSLRIAQ
jgi:hypothetical protein